MIDNAENWPEDSVQECPVYENPYQVNTAGMGWYDSPEEGNGANETENWAEGSGQDLPAYENPYQVSTAGMGWYDSAEDKYDADEANGKFLGSKFDVEVSILLIKALAVTPEVV